VFLLSCQTDCVCEFPDSPVLDKSTVVFSLIRPFHDTGSINDKKCSSQPTVLSDESMVNIHLWKFGPVSTKVFGKLACQSELSYGSVHKVSVNFREPDKGTFWYWQWFQNVIQDGVAIPDKVCFTDEAGSISVDVLIAKITTYGVLKIPILPMSSHYIH